MKTLIFSGFVLLFLCSCQSLECSDRSEEAESWSPLANEKLRFFPSLGRNVVEFSLSDIRREGIGRDCFQDYEVQAFFEQDTIFNQYLRGFSYDIIADEEEAKIRFTFYPSDPAFSGIPSGDFQEIGCVSISTGMPCFASSVESNLIGEMAINGITHQNVVEIIDQRSERETGILVEKLYVNNKGILQIEFEDGEIWTRLF